MKNEFVCSKDGDLVKIVLETYPKLNFNQIKTAFRKKDIKVNGKRLSSSCLISCGDKVEVFLKDKKSKVIEKIYEDQNICVCFKPQGLEVTTLDKAYDSECLEELTGYKAVHRLDKNTEGLVILAKNEHFYNLLVDGFKKGAILKKYVCVVSGKVQKQQNLKAYLVKDKEKNFVKIYDEKVEDAVKIETNYSLLKNYGKLSLIEVELVTGKTHQIRAHLAHAGLNIMGDEKYGDKKINRMYGKKKQCLCANKLAFSFNKNSELFYLNDIIIEVDPTFDIEKIVSR